MLTCSCTRADALLTSDSRLDRRDRGSITMATTLATTLRSTRNTENTPADWSLPRGLLHGAEAPGNAAQAHASETMGANVKSAPGPGPARGANYPPLRCHVRCVTTESCGPIA